MNKACVLAPTATLDPLLGPINLGLGRAAASISELCCCEVGLNTPSLNFYHPAEPREFTELYQGITLRISQAFRSSASGHALFVLDQSGARRLAELLLNKEESHNDFNSNEQAALLELGNIIINGVIGELADHLQEEVSYALPQLQLRGIHSLADLFSDLADPGAARVLLMQVRLSITAEQITGFLFLIFEPTVLSDLLSKLEKSIV